jgi:aminotransferase
MIPLNPNLSGLQRSGIRVYTNLANQTPGCIRFTIGEPDFDTPQAIKDAAWKALQDNQTHYAMNQGQPALRQAIAEYETNRGFSCSPEQILITAGATGALFTAMLGILAPGDEVVIPTPAFPLYESIATIAGASIVRLDTEKTGFQLTEEALSQVISPKTKAIILNSPNNPTGVVYTQESLNAVKNAVLGKPIYVICDNVYQQLCHESCPDLSLDSSLSSQILLCQSFSKPYAMTGWRVGYLAGPEDVISRLLLLHAAEVAAIPTFLQTACITALQTDISAMTDSYRMRREYVCRRLDEMGISYPMPGGAFYIFPDIRKFGLSDDEFCKRMIREAKVAAVPGSCFGQAGYIRISCACSDEELHRGMDAVEVFINTL